MNNPKLVILESPYAGNIPRNLAYGHACLRHSLFLGEAPIASHLLYTQDGVLRDEIGAERELGIAAGLAWKSVAACAVFYIDFGISIGMENALKSYELTQTPFELRNLPAEFWPEDLP